MNSIKSLAALLIIPALATGQDVKYVLKPLPAVEDGRVPVYEWSVDWGLRDDKKPSMGSLLTYRTLASARAAAAAKLANRGDPKEWTYIKMVEVSGVASLQPLDELPAAKGRLWKAIQAGVDKKADACNKLVQDIADAAGVAGLAGKRADEMWGYFNTAAEKDGWKRVTGEKAKGNLPAVSDIDAANRLAEQGYLVVGVISTELLNKHKSPKREKEYEQGHVFAVAPVDGTDWKTTLTANAILNGGADASARYTTADQVIATAGQRDAVQFYAVPLPKK